jgi:hypothetical protein
MKITNKADVKKVFEFVKKHSRCKTGKFNLAEGVDLTLDYSLRYNGEEWEHDVNEQSLKLTGAAKKLFEKLGLDTDDIIYNCEIEYDDIIDMDSIQDEFDTLSAQAGVQEDDFYCFCSENVEDFTWTEFWTNLLEDEIVEDPSKPTPVEFHLNHAYTAIIDKKAGSIKVGCQTFPIAIVRGLVDAYDKAIG